MKNKTLTELRRKVMAREVRERFQDVVEVISELTFAQVNEVTTHEDKMRVLQDSILAAMGLAITWERYPEVWKKDSQKNEQN